MKNDDNEPPAEISPPSDSEYRINGYTVYFPEGRKPFAAQLSVISKVLQALKEGQNALLESPTGTGKVVPSIIYISLLQLDKFKLDDAIDVSSFIQYSSISSQFHRHSSRDRCQARKNRSKR
jgi:hypothetical protein